jgi:hypothetical protein
MRNLRLLFLLCVAFVLLYAVGLMLPWLLMEQPNLLGDTAGAAGGLFSALAFAGVVYTQVRHGHGRCRECRHCPACRPRVRRRKVRHRRHPRR